MLHKSLIACTAAAVVCAGSQAVAAITRYRNQGSSRSSQPSEHQA